jgi:hypothetical protein
MVSTKDKSKDFILSETTEKEGGLLSRHRNIRL